MKQFILKHKKAVAAAATAAIVLSGGFGAFAYFTDSGSGTGTASVGSSSHWSVTSVSTTGGTLYPGQGSDTISAVVQNAGSGNQGLNALTVTVNAPTHTGTILSEGACTAADFALNSAMHSGWVISNGGDTATYANSPAVDILAQDYVVNDADSATSGSNALPAGLTLTMNDLSHAQDNCQGATINLTVAAS